MIAGTLTREESWLADLAFKHYVRARNAETRVRELESQFSQGDAGPGTTADLEGEAEGRDDA